VSLGYASCDIQDIGIDAKGSGPERLNFFGQEVGAEPCPNFIHHLFRGERAVISAIGKP
jgi:hypothetical protein